MKKILIFAFVILCAGTAFSQVEESETSPLKAETGIYYTPQYLFLNGIRFDIERQFEGKRKALVVSPQIYLRYKEDGGGLFGENYTEMIGLGLWVDYKYYLTDRKVTYISAGPSYMYNWSKWQDELIWREDGDELYSEYDDAIQVIHRIGANSTVGFNFELLEKVRLDLFAGFGLRYAIYDSELPQREMDDTMINFGYTGTLLLAGVKIGLNL
jgi:hypothetical protein